MELYEVKESECIINNVYFPVKKNKGLIELRPRYDGDYKMKRHFTKEEVKELIWEHEVYTEHGENRRWSRSNYTVVAVDNTHYGLYWEEGLTENQENMFEGQESDEVELVEKTVVIKKWVNK